MTDAQQSTCPLEKPHLFVEANQEGSCCGGAGQYEPIGDGAQLDLGCDGGPYGVPRLLQHAAVLEVIATEGYSRVAIRGPVEATGWE
ncbi:hypothetical protein Pmani_008980 [Petrolisthes manimaculis]|uniref:Uncharacterized protein n=1 Tax=Petrolisthes manimaculis TaxID=1843537 RepID=A0AAE1Q4K7_9EUCA|nr:hypothetical protein Pmani_008980 [Petrolisthes manimaculis]